MDKSEADSPGHALSEAILRVLAYADIFSYPLTVDEIQRNLEVAASREDVLEALAADPWLRTQVVWQPPYVALASREAWFGRRKGREEANRRLWHEARRYAMLLAGIPFVRMVAVTGALAVDNAPSTTDDIDYLLITTPGRLWLARFLAVLLVRFAALRGVTICPNYLLTLDAIDQFDRSFFTAHELAQMVPLHGHDVYRRLIQVNDWAMRILPNAFDLEAVPVGLSLSTGRRWLKNAAEAILSGVLGEALESLERQRKIRQLSRRAQLSQAQEALFTARYCKGHMNDHGARVAKAYEERVRVVGRRSDTYVD